LDFVSPVLIKVHCNLLQLLNAAERERYAVTPARTTGSRYQACLQVANQQQASATRTRYTESAKVLAAIATDGG